MNNDDNNNNNNNNKNNNNKRLRNQIDIPSVNKKVPIIFVEDFDEIEEQIIKDIENERNKFLELERLKKEEEKKKELESKELVIIENKINSLSDLIDLAKTFDSNKRYNINLGQLNKMISALTDLNNMIGMRKVKHDILEHIIFYLQNLDDKNIDMLHTVIEGPPGVGKTELGKILGQIYLGLGILKNKVFKKVSRTDFVAKYLGQTAIKTEELIDSCEGGVMFIDEVYSLGCKEQRDSFSKEAIDTLNMKLSEMKNSFICIVAGYPKEIEECFFSYNKGLHSRFPVKFSIDPYTPRELFKIFQSIVKQNKWEIDNSIKASFFKKNYDNFKFYGRDMELLFTKCKRAHSKRIFNDASATKKMIILADINIALKTFILNK